MAIRFNGKAIGSVLAMAGVLASAAVVAPSAIAQEPDTVLEGVENLYRNRSGDFYSHRSIWSQMDSISGWGGYPEQRLHGDSASLAQGIEELFILQTQNTPTIRVPDLANPYTTSVQLLPTSQFNSRVIGSELNFEPLPRR
ncbi:MAG: hypothetical protein AAGM27_03215 [Cyanobacteria bacterium J06554_3]